MLDVCTMRLLSERGKVSRKSGILFVLPVYRGKSCLFASFLGTYIRGAFNSRKDCPRRIVTSLFLSRFYRRTLMICETFCGVRVFFFFFGTAIIYLRRKIYFDLYILQGFILILIFVRINAVIFFFLIRDYIWEQIRLMNFEDLVERFGTRI